MPKVGGYVCDDCGAKANSPGRLKNHKKLRCPGPTTDSGTHGTQLQEGHTDRDTNRDTRVSQDFPNDSAELEPGHTGHTAGHTSYSLPLIKESGTHEVVSRLSEPMEVAPNRDAAIISFLSAHTDLLDDYEARFYHSMKYRINSQANHITPAQREYLQQIEAVVKGLLDQDRREREGMRRSAHWLAIREPGHVSQGCDLCDELKEERRKADMAADIGFIEDVIALHFAARRKGGKAITVNEYTGEPVLERVQARSLQGDPEAARVLEALRESEAKNKAAGL